MEIVKILVNILCFVMVVFNMYKFGTESDIEKMLYHGICMLFWLILLII